MSEPLSASLIAALMLLTAIVGGYMAKWIRIPRVIALIVGGVVMKQWIGDGDIVRPLSFVNDLAVGLILFVIGGVFDISRIKSTQGLLRLFSPYEIGTTFGVTAIACTIAAWTLPGMTVALSVSVGLLLACASVATAPAATWYVLREYDAKGPTADHLLVMTGLNNLASIVAFQVTFIVLATLGALKGVHAPQGSWLLNLFVISIGSAVLGGLLGFILSVLHARLPLREMVLLFFSTIFLLSAGDSWMLDHLGFAFNPMLTSLFIGAVFFNTARDAAFFEQTLETISMPIFALFFVLAGYNLHLEELSHLGILGLVYMIARGCGKYFGVRRAVREQGDAATVPESTGLGLLSQAGVAISLGAFLIDEWPHPLAGTLNTVLLASVAVFELTGPLFVKRTLIKAGEVKAVTLLRPGFLQRTWISPGPGMNRLLKEYSDDGKKIPQNEARMTARHLMRTNISFLPHDSNFDAVLEFVERSRFHDFPVVDKDGLYLGMVHFRKIRDQLYGSDTARRATAGTLADPDTPVVTPDAHLPDILRLFHRHNLGEIAVVEDMVHKRPIGLIEQRDLLRVLHV
jgi:Kef-type K+ transport system membrane component KefB/predicted transcriptional regulator